MYDGGVDAKKKQVKNGLQAAHGTAAMAKKGFKRPSPELAELLRLANLVPADVGLPQIKMQDRPGQPLSLHRMVATLPDAVRLDLLETCALPSDFVMTRQHESWGATMGVLEMHAPLALVPNRQHEFWCCAMAMVRYQTIRDARENLRRLVDKTGEPLRFQAQASSGPKGKLKLQFDWGVEALLGAELDYLSRCAYSKCGAFFYAGRRGQPGCFLEHSNTIRKQRKRDADRANAELQAAGKVKRRKARKK